MISFLDIPTLKGGFNRSSDDGKDQEPDLKNVFLGLPRTRLFEADPTDRPNNNVQKKNQREDKGLAREAKHRFLGEGSSGIQKIQESVNDVGLISLETYGLPSCVCVFLFFWAVVLVSLGGGMGED